MVMWTGKVWRRIRSCVSLLWIYFPETSGFITGMGYLDQFHTFDLHSKISTAWNLQVHSLFYFSSRLNLQWSVEWETKKTSFVCETEGKTHFKTSHEGQHSVSVCVAPNQSQLDFNIRSIDTVHSLTDANLLKLLITIYIKIRWLLHVSVYDHHQGACNWALLKLYWY